MFEEWSVILLPIPQLYFTPLTLYYVSFCLCSEMLLLPNGGGSGPICLGQPSNVLCLFSQYFMSITGRLHRSESATSILAGLNLLRKGLVFLLVFIGMILFCNIWKYPVECDPHPATVVFIPHTCALLPFGRLSVCESSHLFNHISLLNN